MRIQSLGSSGRDNGARVNPANNAVLGQVPPSSLPHHANITAYYKCDVGGPGSDATGNGSNLVSVGTGSIAGLINDAVSFADIVLSLMAAASNSNLAIGGGDFSISSWFKYLGVAPTQFPVIVSKFNQAGSSYEYLVAVRADTGQIFFLIGYASNLNFHQRVAASTATDGNWHNILCVHDETGGNDYIYFDGALVGGPFANADGSNAGTNQFDVGSAVSWTPGAPIHDAHAVDEIALWTGVALSAGDALTVYNGGAGQPY